MISQDNIKTLLTSAKEYSSEAKAIVLCALQKGFLTHRKDDNTFVTSVDIDVENRIRALILKEYPAHGIIGEERREENPNPQSDFQWTIDPIDGTGNFRFGMITPATMIGVLYKGDPIVGVVNHNSMDLLYSAAKGLGAFCNNEKITLLGNGNSIVFSGTRAMYARSGDEHLFDKLVREFPDTQVYSDPFSQTQTVHGRVGAVIEFNLKIWDVTPIRILIQEVGGVHRIIKKNFIEGQTMLYSSAFGNAAMVNRLANTLEFSDQNYTLC